MLARALRDFGDGFVAVLLPVYLVALGHTAFEVGVIATAALFGSAVLTLLIGAIGARCDLRTLLLSASLLMAVSGIGYAVADEYWLLTLVALIGTINPSAGSANVFVPLEHTVLAEHVAPLERTRAFARYSLAGALAAACGSLAAAAPEWLATLGLEKLVAFKLMFVAYAALGLANVVVYRGVPHRPRERIGSSRAPLGRSRPVVFKLAALFSLDAFAGGFIVQSLLALWLLERFDLSLATASAVFFWMGVLAAFSFPVAAWLASRIGLVNTMVFTHIPASVCLILAAFAPTLESTVALLLVRAVLGQMDVPARSSYVMAVVGEAERPAAASATAVPRSLAAAASPAIAGMLFAAGLQLWPLLICGGLKIAYDVLLFAAFRRLEPPEERVTATSTTTRSLLRGPERRR
ncbi:MAG TPA: MFS transporter [Gammaproteobacteria bacterium]|nr:MFS transporter [Gammaproteobacteria bacterium]